MSKKAFEFVCSIVDTYLKFHISRSAAALSYFLMLTIFPLLICLHAMLGGIFPELREIIDLLRYILPSGAGETLSEFIMQIDSNVSGRVLALAITAMATSSAAGFRIIDKVMFELRGCKRRQRALAFIFSFVFSLVFLAALYLAAILIATGGRFISFADKYITGLNISDDWQWFRFIILFLLLFVMILGVYRISAPGEGEVLLVPGAFASATALLIVSILFSWFIGMSGRYPLLYGSLASVMIMLLWLYICGNVLFLGNILNICLEKII